jgi:hypothetical protein
MSDLVTITNWWKTLSSTIMFCLMLHNFPKSSLEIQRMHFNEVQRDEENESEKYSQSHVVVWMFGIRKYKQSSFPVAQRFNFGNFRLFSRSFIVFVIKNLGKLIFSSLWNDAKLNFLKDFFFVASAACEELLCMMLW